MSALKHYVRTMALTLVLMVSVSAFADDLAPPPWRLGNAHSTYQHWEFSTDEPEPENWVNPFGTPALTDITNAQWHNNFKDRQGFGSLMMAS